MSSPSSEDFISETKPFLSPGSTSESDLEASPAPVRSRGGHSSAFAVILSFICALVLGLALGYGLGAPSRAESTNGGLLAPAGSVLEVWEHNLTFSQAPTAESEAAWASVIPTGRGFIHHDEIAPFISNIAAFHQLHCLHAILVAHYAARTELELVMGAGLPNDEEPELYGTRIANDHIRHCFDYLRRSIMCASDTNLEVVDRVNHTTNGWGQEKKCRDFNTIFRFAEEWANSTDTGIVT